MCSTLSSGVWGTLAELAIFSLPAKMFLFSLGRAGMQGPHSCQGQSTCGPHLSRKRQSGNNRNQSNALSAQHPHYIFSLSLVAWQDSRTQNSHLLAPTRALIDHEAQYKSREPLNNVPQAYLAGTSLSRHPTESAAYERQCCVIPESCTEHWIDFV